MTETIKINECRTLPPCPPVRWERKELGTDNPHTAYIAWVGVIQIGLFSLFQNPSCEILYDGCYKRRSFSTIEEAIEAGKSSIEQEWKGTWDDYHTQPTETTP